MDMSSDESDFYGDDDIVIELKRRVDHFDITQWWQEHEALETPLKLQAKGGPGDTSHLHNPYAGDKYAWQLTESVDAFLNRLPPATTEEAPGHSWIWICNPYIKRQPKSKAKNQRVRGGEDEVPEDEGADLVTLMQAGEERLDFASSFVNECRKSGQSKAIITRETRKAGMDAVKDILGLAKGLRVTCGKWMLFCTVFEVNEIWAIIAKATANNELGIAAKVAPKSKVDQRTERLICVYTADFSDKKDVTRVAERLKQLGLVKSKPLYYKPDAYTYLGIASGNPWEIRASIYDTRSLLGK
ncbi:DUF1917-domain-containing protein [Xylariaceae sp. AK1471]|nr:DUF1917-domain-containing protein [Xylariaceae sp. AK1471]